MDMECERDPLEQALWVFLFHRQWKRCHIQNEPKYIYMYIYKAVTLRPSQAFLNSVNFDDAVT